MNPERTIKTAAAAASEGDIQSSTKASKRSIASQSSPSAACLLCEGSGESRLLFHTSRPIFQCTSCGLVYADPRTAPAVDYSEDYYRDGVYADYLADRDAIQRNAPRVLEELERMVKGRKLLDVGCATGFFLEAARARRWDVRGLEASKYASDYARRELGLEVETASIVWPPEGLPLFDVVTLWDTIEHLDRPDLALANIRGLLDSNGVLVFSTGDYASLLRRLTGKRWRLFADPTHNFFFDEETLRLMLMRAGFEVLRVTRRGKRVSLSLILHQSGLPLSARLRRWLLGKGWNPSVYVNLRDVVTIFARPHSPATTETSPR
jgi:2-polyprenyl-3-methyl-5-hydroxy-6-metoxy-1,4-benzoquinol methylase